MDLQAIFGIKREGVTVAPAPTGEVHVHMLKGLDYSTWIPRRGADGRHGFDRPGLPLSECWWLRCSASLPAEEGAP